jgi:hypothetical protein
MRERSTFQVGTVKPDDMGPLPSAFCISSAFTKTLSENLSMRLEERRTSPRMGLSMYPFSKEMRPLREPNTTNKSVDYFRLPRPLWRKLKKCLPNKCNNTRRGGRPRASNRAVMDAQIGTCCGAAANGEGRPVRLVRGKL